MADIVFVGPAPETLELFGDKTRARALARDCGVPVSEGTQGPTTLDQARAFMAQHGPVMVKAVAGGGGRGMRAVTSLPYLEDAFTRCPRPHDGVDLHVIEQLLIHPLSRPAQRKLPQRS